MIQFWPKRSEKSDGVLGRSFASPEKRGQQYRCCVLPLLSFLNVMAGATVAIL